MRLFSSGPCVLNFSLTFISSYLQLIHTKMVYNQSNTTYLCHLIVLQFLEVSKRKDPTSFFFLSVILKLSFYFHQILLDRNQSVVDFFHINSFY